MPSARMNRIYGIDEGRPFWKLRPILLVLTLVAVALAAVAVLLLIVSGPVAESIGNVLGVGDTALTTWKIAKWPVLALIVVLVVGLLYYTTPNVQQRRKFRWISVGAAVAILIWVLASVGFSIYVANFSNYNKTYGSLAGVIVALLFLWITNLALLFGGELNAELERGRQLQAGIAAEEGLQLQVRDTHGIKKAREKRDKDAALGRRIRRQAAAEQRIGAGARLPEGEEMKKLLILVAAGIGYVLGTKAGRQRYEQLRSTFNKVKDDPRVQEKAHYAADLAKEKAPVVTEKVTHAADAASAKVRSGRGSSDAAAELDPINPELDPNSPELDPNRTVLEDMSGVKDKQP